MQCRHGLIWMVAACLAWSGLTGDALGAPRKQLEMEQAFKKYHTKLFEADEQRDNGDVAGSVALYQEVLAGYARLVKRYPSHERAMVQFRMSYCSTQIARLSEELGVPEAQPVVTPAPVTPPDDADRPAVVIPVEPVTPTATAVTPIVPVAPVATLVTPTPVPVEPPAPVATPVAPAPVPVAPPAAVAAAPTIAAALPEMAAITPASLPAGSMPVGELSTEIRTMLAMGMSDKALARVDAAAKMRPDDGGVQLLRGLVLTRMGRHDEAAKTLNPMVKDRSVAAMLALAGTRFSEGKYMESMRLLEGALAIDPNLPEAYVNLAYLSLAISPNKLNEATLYYRYALKLGGQRDTRLDVILKP